MKKLINILFLLTFVSLASFSQADIGITSTEADVATISLTANSNYAIGGWNSRTFTIRYETALGVVGAPTVTNVGSNNFSVVTTEDKSDGFTYVVLNDNGPTTYPVAAGETLPLFDLTFDDPVIHDNAEPVELITGTIEVDEVLGTASINHQFFGEVFNAFGPASANVLPIELYGFTATKETSKSVKLDWETASEINGSHFDVQRSRNLDNWTTVGTVSAVGESTSLQSYSLIDKDLPLSARGASKVFYYRLNMVDNDGSQEYSDIRTVRFDQEGADFIVYPNPTNNEVFVNLSSITTETGPATMNVMNLQGQLVKKVTLSTNDDIKVDVTDIQAGAYFFIVRQGEQTFSQKVLKVN